MKHSISIPIIVGLTISGLIGLYLIRKASTTEKQPHLFLIGAILFVGISVLLIYSLFIHEKESLALLTGLWSIAYIIGATLVGIIIFAERPQLSVWIGVGLAILSLLFLIDIFRLNKYVK